MKLEERRVNLSLFPSVASLGGWVVSIASIQRCTVTFIRPATGISRPITLMVALS